MSRGRPFQPGNKLGRGRPKGSRNKVTHEAQKLFDKHAAAIIALAINKSRENAPILRMLASRIVPQQREAPLKLGNLATKTLEDLDLVSEILLEKAISGKIAPSDAQEISTMLENRRRVIETRDLNRRIKALEDSAHE